MRPFLRLILALGFCGIAADMAGAAEGRLYPSGPPNGVAYLRFANLSAGPVKVTSAGGALDLPAADAQRVGEFDPVTPGTELTGTVAIGDKAAPLKLTLTPNEFVTVAITAGAEGPPTVTLLREEPSDFNAQRSALALYNLDKTCAAGQLQAGDEHTVVISDVKPGATGRRLVNPVNVPLSVVCGDQGGKGTPATLGAMAAGDRYSIFIYATSGPGGRQTLAMTDKLAPFRP